MQVRLYVLAVQLGDRWLKGLTQPEEPESGLYVTKGHPSSRPIYLHS